MKFKDNLRKQRNLAHLSQESLADQMSVSRQTISKWENGDTYPSTKHIFMLAKILNCNFNNLIDSESNHKTSNQISPGPNHITDNQANPKSRHDRNRRHHLPRLRTNWRTTRKNHRRPRRSQSNHL